MRRGAIILCGGKSSRMGHDKASLPFGAESMLQRVTRLVSQAISLNQIVVVAARDQALPSLPVEVRIVRDESPDRGPLEGLAAGLRALADNADAAYVTSCDVPLLSPLLIDRMFEWLGDHEIAVPFDGERFHPLTAVYRLTVLPQIQQMLTTNQLRIRGLFDKIATYRVTIDELRSVDPTLSSLQNLNQPEDYFAALNAAGFQAPDIRF